MKVTPWAWATWVMARSVRWRGTRHSPAPTRVTVRRRVTAVGTTRIESAYVSAARPRARPAGVCAWRWWWRPRRDASRTAAVSPYAELFFFRTLTRRSHTLSRCAEIRDSALATATAGARPRQRSRGRGHAGPVTR